MSQIFNRVLFLLMLVALSSSHSVAQEVAGAKEATQFEDWGRTCNKIPGTEDDVCFLFQRLRMKESEQVVMGTTVAINPKDKTTVLSVTVPLGVLLQPGIQMKVDQTEQVVKAPFLICMQVGCRASTVLDSEMVSRLQSGQQLLVAFVGANRKPSTVPVSLKGFATGYETLAK